MKALILVSASPIMLCAAFTVPSSNNVMLPLRSTWKRTLGRNAGFIAVNDLGRHTSNFRTTGITSIRMTPEEQLDQYLEESNVKEATELLKSNPNTKLSKQRFISIFDAIEIRTSQAEENFLRTNPSPSSDGMVMEYPLESPSRMEMTEMYTTLKELEHLSLFGAASKHTPAEGSKITTPTLLEQITGLSMKALTPRPTNTLLIAGALFGLLEGAISLATGIDIGVMLLGTTLFAVLDRLLVNGALFESFTRTIMPELDTKILRHEAGHFLVAYLLGCPVEGCVLNTWEALKDLRFGGPRTGLSAGTSFFDAELSEQVNGKRPLRRSAIDRFTMIVMAGIAAEALYFGQADGGAGDEISLIRFLSQLAPSGGSARSYNTETIKNQARWGALNAVLLLKHYKSSYEALVEALEGGANLGECVYAIEKAARDNDLKPLAAPEGYIVDKDPYGEWILEAEYVKEDIDMRPMVPEVTQTFGGTTKLVNGAMDIENLTAASDEERLKQYRKMMEEKLKNINDQLSEY